MDEGALNLLEDALDYHFVGEDENGDPVGSGDFSLYQLLDFWSGYDPSRVEQQPGGVEYYHGTKLTHKDVIMALINEIRRLRGIQ